MANGINNKYEYRSGLLDSLNVQHTASDVRNEDEYRKKVLNGLGVEYTEDDINQKNLYRAKVVEGLASSGGGGSSDFSTAEVTLVCNNSEVGEGGLNVATADNIDNASRTGMIVEYGTPITRTVILYKGKAIAMTEFDNVACEGNATYDSENYIIYITGDCTITIS